MDAPAERDIKLQRASGNLLAELKSRLPNFLTKKTSSPDENQNQRARRTVGKSDTDSLIQLLEPFQEWPQLLDPHLASLVPPLIDAYLTYLVRHGEFYRSSAIVKPAVRVPLPRAICRLLYTLCKVRGEKVITRFFSNEPKYLELLLHAFEAWDLSEKPHTEVDHGRLIWEERYIMLLWLSHLLLAPFDLASISSTPDCGQKTGVVNLFRLDLPTVLPDISRRLIPICFNYICVASKEREAATKLLARLALRPDMSRAGLLDSLVLWAISSLDFESNESLDTSIFVHIGILSFLAALLQSAEKEAIAPFILQIFHAVQHLNQSEETLSKHIKSSALARKIMIKILRAMAILVLQPGPPLPNIENAGIKDVILEEVIDQLLSDLADKDTPVRYAASKALSVITLKLDTTLASEVVEAVLGTFEEDVLWDDPESGLALPNARVGHLKDVTLVRNLTAVNPLKWQGLVLTLAHLLFRRSPPPDMLPRILHALLLALSFEQRSSTGSSIGTNVRDAACFGIWALSRRYTTKELLAVDTAAIRAASVTDTTMSIPQVLAIELVVAATVDPSGNIRRGSSAALQELIGRHPDTIREGIPLVQVVDYHAVARRSKAVTEVVIGSAKLDQAYWAALSDALLDWRGIGASDAESRRLAATSIGALSALRGEEGIMSNVRIIVRKLSNLKLGEVELKHGFLMALAAIVKNATELSHGPTFAGNSVPTRKELSDLWNIFSTVPSISEGDLTSAVLRPELTSEGISCLISSLAHASAAAPQGRPFLPKPSHQSLLKALDFLSLSLLRTEDKVIISASTAVQDLFAILDPSKRGEVVRAWVSLVAVNKANRTWGAGRGLGHIAALGAVFKYFLSEDSVNSTADREAIILALVARASHEVELESRVAAVSSLCTGVVGSGVLDSRITQVLNAALDDYTTDQRGDVGSLVRIQAIDMVAMAWSKDLLGEENNRRQILGRVCRLAAEKLDKVRFRAWLCLQEVLGQNYLPVAFSDISQISSYAYFRQLLSLTSESWLRLPLLEGYVTSAGVGSESLLHASRLALVDYVEVTSAEAQAHSLCSDLVELLGRCLANDRLAIPILEVLGFLFDAGVLEEFDDVSFNWRGVYNVVQRAHFKSRNVQKLEAAVQIYAALSEVGPLRHEAKTKLIKMLKHPFPKIQSSAADALYVLGYHEEAV